MRTGSATRAERQHLLTAHERGCPTHPTGRQYRLLIDKGGATAYFLTAHAALIRLLRQRRMSVRQLQVLPQTLLPSAIRTAHDN